MPTTSPTGAGPMRSTTRPAMGPTAAPSTAPAAKQIAITSTEVPLLPRPSGTSRSTAPKAQRSIRLMAMAAIVAGCRAPRAIEAQRRDSPAATARPVGASSGEHDAHEADGGDQPECEAGAGGGGEGADAGAGDRPGREQAHHDAGLAAAVAGRGVVGDPGHGGRPDRAAGEALDEPGQDQHLDVRRPGEDDRGDGHQQRGDRARCGGRRCAAPARCSRARRTAPRPGRRPAPGRPGRCSG